MQSSPSGATATSESGKGQLSIAGEAVMTPEATHNSYNQIIGDECKSISRC